MHFLTRNLVILETVENLIALVRSVTAIYSFNYYEAYRLKMYTFTPIRVQSKQSLLTFFIELATIDIFYCEKVDSAQTKLLYEKTFHEMKKNWFPHMHMITDRKMGKFEK